MHRRSALRSAVLLSATLAAHLATAQINGDYRSVASGDWATASTWELYTAGNWLAAATAPLITSGTISIRSGHSVSLPASNLEVDQVVVDVGGTLSTNPFADLTVLDGAGTDLLVNGTLAHAGQYLQGPGSIVVASGGLYTLTNGYIGDGAVVDLQGGASASSNGNVYVDGTVNNAGTWTMQSGYLRTTGFGQHVFNNLSSGMLIFNGWADPALSLSSLIVNNAGTIEQNNSPVEFTWWSATLNNTGTVNVNGGVFGQHFGAITNTGVIAFDPGSSQKLVSGDFFNEAGGSITGLPHLISNGDLFLNAGSSCDPLPLITNPGGYITFGEPLVVHQYDLTGGGFYGPAEVTIPSGGQFNMSNAYVNAGAVLHISTGAAATTNGNVYLDGTVNNEGTWTMQSGSTYTTGFGEHTFNNLSGGVMDLNGWTDINLSLSSIELHNHGTINKNNGAIQFTFWNPNFHNEPGGVFNIPDGIVKFANGIFGPGKGTFNIGSTATIHADMALPFDDVTIVNDGAITAPGVIFQGSATPELSGAGHIPYLTMNCTCDLSLGSSHTVDSVLTLTAGRIALGTHDLLLPRTAANSLVGGGASSYVLTESTGGLLRGMNSDPHTFAIGTSDSYLPVTVANLTGPAETFTARVIDGVSTAYNAPGEAIGLPVTQHNLLNTWVITEGTDGGNNAQLTFQWNSADEGAPFDRNACAALAYDGLTWVVVDPFTPATGPGPYTQVGQSFDGFREFTVGDAASLALTVGVEEQTPTTLLHAFPNPMSDQLTLSSNSPILSFELHDALGRVVRTGSVNANAWVLQRGTLNAGAYVISVRTAEGSTRIHVVIE